MFFNRLFNRGYFVDYVVSKEDNFDFKKNIRKVKVKEKIRMTRRFKIVQEVIKRNKTEDSLYKKDVHLANDKKDKSKWVDISVTRNLDKNNFGKGLGSNGTEEEFENVRDKLESSQKI